MYCDAYGEMINKSTCKNCSIKRKRDVETNFIFFNDEKCEFGE